jgi:hypothetical protein
MKIIDGIGSNMAFSSICPNLAVCIDSDMLFANVVHELLGKINIFLRRQKYQALRYIRGAVGPQPDLGAMGEKFINPDCGPRESFVLLPFARCTEVKTQDMADIVSAMVIVIRRRVLIRADFADYLVDTLIQLMGCDHYSLSLLCRNRIELRSTVSRNATDAQIASVFRSHWFF